MERDFDAIFRGKTILLIHPSGVGRKPIYQRLQDFGARLWCFHFDVVSVFSDVIERWIVPPTGSYQSVDEAKAFILQFLSEEGVRPDAVLTYDEYAPAPRYSASTCCKLTRGGAGSVSCWPATCRQSSGFQAYLSGWRRPVGTRQSSELPVLSGVCPVFGNGMPSVYQLH